MSDASVARTVSVRRPTDVDPPFSNFEFVEDHFPRSKAIRRILSQARAAKTRTMLVEEIKPRGSLIAENEEILRYHPEARMRELLRISFWQKPFKKENDVHNLADTDCLGYAVLKRHEGLAGGENGEWHVYESVMRKYPHHHNCIPGERTFPVKILGQKFSVPGVMYFQQNGLNKACAQVALKTLLSAYFPDREISFPEINKIAGTGRKKFQPIEGLDAEQIHSVLKHFDVGYDSIDYKRVDSFYREMVPYQKLVYSGIESGAGALLGFQF